MKIFAKFIAFCLFVALLPINVYGQEKSFSWYCKRNARHDQPCIDTQIDFVSNYDVYWCDRNHSQMSEDRVIYLTFDAGYENGNVSKILDVLKEESVPATFFVLDHLIKDERNLVERMINEGHIVANHTMKHRDMTKMKTKEEFARELRDLEQLYHSTFGEEMAKLYRPPEGKFNESNLKWATELGYKTVFWSFAYADWDNNKQPSKNEALKKITDNLHNGEIMLLHPTSSTNAQIMREMITFLKKEGFRFGRLDEIS